MRTNVNMISIVLFIILIFMCGCSRNQDEDQSVIETKEQIVINNDPSCVEFIALWSAGDIAEKIGKDKKWIFLNYTVDLWDAPPSYKKGNIIGKLRASSYARILATKGDDYKVESPVNNIQGWISSEHVKAISWKNPKTKKLCK